MSVTREKSIGTFGSTVPAMASLMLESNGVRSPLKPSRNFSWMMMCGLSGLEAKADVKKVGRDVKAAGKDVEKAVEKGGQDLKKAGQKIKKKM